jgi:hypothetical protein
MLFSFAIACVLQSPQDPAAKAPPEPRLHTTRAAGSQLLKLPKEDDAFGFIVYGDRTGGPVEGIEVLKQAVTDTNLLDPDLVMTVGDLINGYNGHDAWMAQAAEYKAAMAALRMPWFPVAGNHDVYWRGAGKPIGEHEGNFEATFGPLWYSVLHKQCCFVVLYSDEGNPETGEKDFNKPDCQRISEAQFAWLDATLTRAKDARHVFVFLHHPRWLAKYGTDWDRVHTRLVQAKNVTAVFAGHIHCMRFDGKRDGIQYYTVASVGAFLDIEAKDAGFLHEFHVVTVRKEGITVAAVPVGAVLDPQQITGDINDDVEAVFAALQPELAGCVAAGGGEAVGLDGAVDAVVTLRCRNPGKRPIELEITPLGDNYSFGPDHQHVIVAGQQTATTTFLLRRQAQVAMPFALPRLAVRCDYLGPHRRIGLPPLTFSLELPAPAELGRQLSPHPGVLVLDGKEARLEVPHSQIMLPDGPFTIEAWVRADDLVGERTIVAKTQSAEFGLAAVDGELKFEVRIGKRYEVARSREAVVQVGRWQHVAGVFDGQQLRAYVDGELVGSRDASGARVTNAEPLLIGADPESGGKARYFFQGRIDDVRLSIGARYAAAFEPAQTHTADAATVLLLPCDADFGPWCADVSGQRRHGLRRGNVYCTFEAR